MVTNVQKYLNQKFGDVSESVMQSRRPQSSPDYINFNDAIMNAMTSQITSLTIVYSVVYSRRRPKKISKHKGPVTRKMFPFDDVIMVPANMRCHHILIE